MQNRTFWRRWTKSVGLNGTVRSLEVTYGLNGPHVHVHVLLFCTAPAAVLRACELLSAWKQACLDAGLDEPNAHGVDIQVGNAVVGDYVGKWGMDYELTKSHVKRGRGTEGRTPFDLLRASAAGDEAAGRLFIEYANAFKGRRQLVWSKGLRKLLQLGREETDLELAEKHGEDAEYVGTISGDEHSGDLGRLIRWRAHGPLLAAVEREGRSGLTRFLRGLEALDARRSQGGHVWRN
jgi:hypothetical protein